MIPPVPPDDIAIIGMSCRVAGADSPSKLWELLASSKDVRKEIDRFNSAGYYKATGSSRKGLTNVRHAYLLEEDIDRFDNGFFATPAAEAEAMDPQQRLLLEIAYEAMENAGIPLEKIQGTDTAVYAGRSIPLLCRRNLSLLHVAICRSFLFHYSVNGFAVLWF